MSPQQLEDLSVLFEKRFLAATSGLLTGKVQRKFIVPLKKMDRDLESIRAHIGGPEEKKTRARLERLWYYYSDTPLPREIFNELLDREGPEVLEGIDGILVISSPQFDGIGFASGALAVTEYPTEIAWKSSDGGSTLYETPHRLVDELVHEAGHLLGLDHASSQCNDLPVAERDRCCAESPGAKDVMSYCRNRRAVSELQFFSYTQCSLDYLESTTIPALLQGGKRTFQESTCP